MKPFVRLTIFVLLLGSVFLGRFTAPGRTSATTATFQPRVRLDEIRARGTLDVAVAGGSVTYFFHRGNPVGFEYELLGRFASEVGLTLRIHQTPSPGAAAALLLSDRVHIAVLPLAEGEGLDGAIRSIAYLRHGLTQEERSAGLPSTGAIFVRRNLSELRATLDRFLQRSARDGAIKMLYERYFRRCESLGVRVVGGRLVPPPVQLSEFDSLIAKHAGSAGMDWRLVAALITEESAFDAAAVSPRGARGLMQLMPFIADGVAVTDLHEPEINILAGIRYLQRLSVMFPRAQGESRLAIVLAAYLLGPGHVFDARRLASDLGLDPDVWTESLDQAIPLLENPTFFRGTRFGFAQGRHAVRYVNRILRRYELYKQQVAVEIRRPERVARIRM